MKSLFLSVFTFFTLNAISAQTVMQLNGQDCNGNNHDLFADLDSGKAVVLFFFMPNCPSCPPPAQKIQKMANDLMVAYPNTIRGYALPYNNTTNCAATASWVTNSNVPFYAPYDSGATMVANYGGFGMPTVVVLGGKGSNRKVLFSTKVFKDSDTAIMRDSIKSVIIPKSTSSVHQMLSNQISMIQVDVYNNQLKFECAVSTNQIKATILDMMGKVLVEAPIEKGDMQLMKSISIKSIPTGNYILRLEADGWNESKQFNITR